MGKKIIKWCGMIVAVLFVIAALLFGWFEYMSRYQIGDIDAAVSPDGTYELLYQSVGEPDWPFGASHARLVLKHNGKTIIKFKFDVANDGGILYPDSWRVNWTEDAAEVTVSGEEQWDKLYVLRFDGSVEEIALETRYGEAWGG